MTFGLPSCRHVVLEPYAGLHEVPLSDVGISLPESGCMHHFVSKLSVSDKK